MFVPVLRRWSAALFCSAALALGANHAVAQGTVQLNALPEPVPGTIIGVVVDSVSRPIPDITVYVYELRRQVRSGPDGRFRFDDVRKGKYTISARSVGFLGATERINVKASGAVIRLRMTQLERGLPPVITTAVRGGLSGFVADTSLRALRDATVKVLGSALTTTTDSAGRFYLAAKPGSYLVRVERKGYDRQLLGITIPANEGREVSIWLTRGAERENPLVGANLFDFEQRRIRGRAVSYASFSRDDLMATNAPDVMQAAARVTVQRPAFDACAYLDGGPSMAPLWAIAVGEVEFVEAVLPGNNGRGAPDILGRPSSARGNCAYIVWLRK
jgi:hypothetical protein